MNDITESAFVRRDLVLERAAPVKTTGFAGFLRTRLFNSPTNILISLVSALLLWFILVPTIKFLLIDAVWSGKDRTACLAENAGHPVGACWPFIQAKFSQFIYGFYPEPERWRVNLTFFLAAILLLPLLIPRLPAKGVNANLFFLAFPAIAFFLLHGGGLEGFALSWTAGFLSGFASSIAHAGGDLSRAGASLADSTSVGGPLLKLLGWFVVQLGEALHYLILPLTWLRDQIQMSRRPVWIDFGLTAAIVSTLLFWLNGGTRAGWRPLITSLSTFAGLGIVIAIMGLDRGGLPVVDTRLWGGLLVTLVVSVTGIVASMPVGIALALGRRSTIPLIRIFDGLHRVLARRAADHGAVFRDLHAAAVRSNRIQCRRADAGPDRHRLVRRRLSGRGHPGRPAGDPARAGRGRERAWPLLVEDDSIDRDAAGAAPRHPGPGQQLHCAVQGHLIGFDRCAVRFARTAPGILQRPRMGDTDHAVYRVRLHRIDLL